MDAVGEIVIQRWCDMRYPGQAYEVLVLCPDGPLDAAAIRSLVEEFHRRHEQAFAFSDPDEGPVVR